MSQTTPSTKAYAAESATSPLAFTRIARRDPRPNDVQIQILYCGVCHSDLHQARNEWQGSTFPIVPGHEIVGRVVKAGKNVKKLKEGDLAAVGCMVDSCRVCAPCRAGLEQYCTNSCTWTYNSEDKISGGTTYGGYSESIVVDEAFTLKLSEKVDLAATAPLLCAGITTWSPLKHWKVGPGKRVGIVGLGGLGHMAIKFARAFGAQVVLFTTSPGKIADAKRLGAHEVVLSKDAAEMAKQAGSFDFVLDLVSGTHDVNSYLQLLKLDGAMVMCGAPPEPLSVSVFNLLLPRRSLAGSGIGGIAETQEMLDFCAEHEIKSDIELIKIQQINEAYERLLKGDVKYRFVIDLASLTG
jgi:uncharacterized zinc-type alcohol dehydrogenase-like protein